MTDLSTVVNTGVFGAEAIIRDDNLFADTTSTMGDLDGTNRYIPMLYAKKVLYDFYKATLYTEVTNTDLTSRSLVA